MRVKRKQSMPEKIVDFFYYHWPEVFVLGLLFVGGFGLWLALFFTNSYSCTSRWEPSYQPQYALFSGCLIVVDGHRIPASNYRIM